MGVYTDKGQISWAYILGGGLRLGRKNTSICNLLNFYTLFSYFFPINMEGDIYSGCLLGFIFGGHLFFVGGGGRAYIRECICGILRYSSKGLIIWKRQST